MLRFPQLQIVYKLIYNLYILCNANTIHFKYRLLYINILTYIIFSNWNQFEYKKVPVLESSSILLWVESLIPLSFNMKPFVKVIYILRRIDKGEGVD